MLTMILNFSNLDVVNFCNKNYSVFHTLRYNIIFSILYNILVRGSCSSIRLTSLILNIFKSIVIYDIDMLFSI